MVGGGVVGGGVVGGGVVVTGGSGKWEVGGGRWRVCGNFDIISTLSRVSQTHSRVPCDTSDPCMLIGDDHI